LTSKENGMLGAIIGDMCGAPYEFNPTKRTDVGLLDAGEADDNRGGFFFTDDTVLTAAVAESLLDGKAYGDTMVEWVLANMHDRVGYGAHFLKWALNYNREPYGSWGNGSAMRVSPVAWLAQDMAEVCRMAKESAEVTHNHPEGVRGAQATAVAIRMALEGWSKEDIRRVMVENFRYADVDVPLEEIRPTYKFQVSCQKSVPQAIRCFLEAEDFLGTIRNCISLGGDADTMAAIAGAIAEPFYGIPAEIEALGRDLMTEEVLAVLVRFRQAVQGRSYAKSDLSQVVAWVNDPEPPYPLDKATQMRYEAEMAKIEAVEAMLRGEDPYQGQSFFVRIWRRIFG
jgi:ADP-ribosylglycohydrolase